MWDENCCQILEELCILHLLTLRLHACSRYSKKVNSVNEDALITSIPWLTAGCTELEHQTPTGFKSEGCYLIGCKTRGVAGLWKDCSTMQLGYQHPAAPFRASASLRLCVVANSNQSFFIHILTDEQWPAPVSLEPHPGNFFSVTHWPMWHGWTHPWSQGCGMTSVGPLSCCGKSRRYHFIPQADTFLSFFIN